MRTSVVEFMDSPPIDPAATMAVPVTDRRRIASFPYHPGDIILPGYQLARRLGKGGFGEVWRATAPGGMGVAIKVLANLGRREAGREYRALQTIRNIRHAHIVPLFGVWLKSGDGRLLEDSELRDAEQRLLANRADEAASMESLELIVAMGLGDQTLADRLDDVRRDAGATEETPAIGLPVQSLLDWFHQAALALDHFNGGAIRGGENLRAVQHCDIKPQNLLLVGNAVQVCDFGLARAQEEVRATGNTMASLAYAAPELVTAPYDPSPSTDQYSLALSYVELRTGRLPYDDIGPVAILKAKLDGAIDLSALGAAEAVVVGRALALDPARRWQNCVEFARALRAAIPPDVLRAAAVKDDAPAARILTRPDAESPAPVAPRPGAVPAARVGPSRLAVSVGLGGAAVAVIAALLPWLAGQRGPAPDAATVGGTPAAATPDAADRDAAEAWREAEAAAAGGRPQEAIAPLRVLERLYAADRPPVVEGLSRWHVVNSLAWYLATAAGDDPTAAADARRFSAEALSLADTDPQLAAAMGDEPSRREQVRVQSLDTAAAAAARAGDFTEAVRVIRTAIAAVRDPAERQGFERRLAAYEQGQAWHEP
jgi:serine/threonine protein kinase